MALTAGVMGTAIVKKGTLLFFTLGMLVVTSIYNTVKNFPIALLKQQTCSCLLDGHPFLGDRNACLGDRKACCKKNSVVKCNIETVVLIKIIKPTESRSQIYTRPIDYPSLLQGVLLV